MVSAPAASGAAGASSDANAIPAARVTVTHGFKQDTYTLGNDEGQVILQWPLKMSQESYDEFVEWLDLQKRKIARLSGVKLPDPKKPQ